MIDFESRNRYEDPRNTRLAKAAQIRKKLTEEENDCSYNPSSPYNSLKRLETLVKASGIKEDLTGGKNALAGLTRIRGLIHKGGYDHAQAIFDHLEGVLSSGQTNRTFLNISDLDSGDDMLKLLDDVFLEVPESVKEKLQESSRDHGSLLACNVLTGQYWPNFPTRSFLEQFGNEDEKQDNYWVPTFIEGVSVNCYFPPRDGFEEDDFEDEIFVKPILSLRIDPLE